MRVLLCGAGGFLGTHLVHELHQSGHHLTAVARRDRATELAGRGCEVVEADLSEKRDLPDLPPQEVACFLAQSSAYRRWPEGAGDVVDVNLAGLIRFAEAARRARVRRFFYASTGALYRPSFEPLSESGAVETEGLYALTKRAGEEILAQYRAFFDPVFMRLFALYGPGQKDRMIPHILSRVARGEPVYLEPRRPGEREPDGLVMTPCQVQNAARCIAKLLLSAVSGAINVAGPERVSVRRIAEEAGQLLGKRVEFELRPEPRRGDLIADASKLRETVDVVFTPFSEGLRQVIATDFPPDQVRE